MEEDSDPASNSRRGIKPYVSVVEAIASEHAELHWPQLLRLRPPGEDESGTRRDHHDQALFHKILPEK
jgi:hypothetical protein